MEGPRNNYLTQRGVEAFCAVRPTAAPARPPRAGALQLALRLTLPSTIRAQRLVGRPLFVEGLLQDVGTPRESLLTRRP
jgi:hypothetical protein